MKSFLLQPPPCIARRGPGSTNLSIEARETEHLLVALPRRRARHNPEPMIARRALSRRTRPFQESVIREMTRLHAEVGGVNLAQGLPDFEPPKELVDALARAVPLPANHQYGWTWGLPALRAAVSEKTARVNGIRSDPEKEVTITCGVSEAVVAAVLALTEPGDEAIILEPWYENYVPACVLAGVKPRFVALSEPDFRLDV